MSEDQIPPLSFRPIVRDGIARLAREHWSTGRSPWDVQDDGRALTVDSLTVGVEPADDAVAALLDVEIGADVVVRRRRYLLDARPVLLATSWLPGSIAVGTAIAEANPGPGGIYASLGDLGHAPVRFREDVHARMPSPEEIKGLELDAGVPAVQIVRTAIGADGHPVEVNEMTLDASAYVLRYDFDA